MNCKLVSGSEPIFHFRLKPYQQTRTSVLEPCFGTQLARQSLSIKPNCRRRTGARVSAFYASPQTATETFYDLLGIPVSGSISEIKSAYKQLARKYHPDVSPPDRTEEYTRRFILVQEAYETLSDPQTRAVYDRDLSQGLHLVFSARRRSNYDQRSEEVGGWRNRWQSQLTELRRRRSVNNDLRGAMSWGGRMRRPRVDIFDIGLN